MKRKRKTSVGKKSIVFGDVLDIIDDQTEQRNPDLGPEEGDSIYTIRVSLDQVVVALRHPSALYFRGVVEAKAIAGSFETLGYQVNDDDGRTYTLFSLEDSSANYISTVRYTVMTGRYLNVLFQLGLNEDVIYKIVNHVGCMGTVILLSNAVERFQRLNEFLISLDIHVFPAKLKKKGFPLFPEAEEALGAIFDDAGGTRIPKKLNICKDWDVIMSAFPTDQHFKVLFCGGKGVGKSTTMRYMINRRLQVSPKVLVIDLDIGQSEFTICGSVSAVVVYTPLLGPNYTHLKNPSRSYFVGNVDISMSISSYLSAVRQLLNYCLYNPQFSNCTWFINTMGITKGIGLGLLATIIKLVLPDFVLQIQSNDNQLNFDTQLQPQNIVNFGAPRLSDIKNYTLFTVRSAVVSSIKDRRISNMIGLTPKILREIVMLVYLTRAAIDNIKRSRFFKYVKISEKDWKPPSTCDKHCEQVSSFSADCIVSKDKELDQTKNIACGCWELVTLSCSSIEEHNPIVVGHGLAKECVENGQRYMLVLSPLSAKTWCTVKSVFLAENVNLSKTLVTLVTRVFDSHGLVPGMIVSDFRDTDGNEIPIKKQLFFD